MDKGEQRLDPNALPDEPKDQQQKSLGRLKIYFGYAAGVGKCLHHRQCAAHGKPE